MKERKGETDAKILVTVMSPGLRSCCPPKWFLAYIMRALLNTKVFEFHQFRLFSTWFIVRTQ